MYIQAVTSDGRVRGERCKLSGEFVIIGVPVDPPSKNIVTRGSISDERSATVQQGVIFSAAKEVAASEALERNWFR